MYNSIYNSSVMIGDLGRGEARALDQGFTQLYFLAGGVSCKHEQVKNLKDVALAS